MYQALTLFSVFIASRRAETIERIVRGLTWFMFDLCKLRRKLILNNLQIAFGKEKSAEELEKIGRESVYHFLCSLFEIMYSAKNKIHEDIQIIGKENLDRALAPQKGAYVICCHVGNWEAMGAAYTHSLTPAHVIVKKIGVPSVNRFIEETRDRIGFRYVKREKKGDAYRQIGQILGRNEIVGFVMDQARPGEPRLPFFGTPAKTNTSFAAIWRRTPAPIVPSFIVRRAFNKHTLYVWPEIAVTTTNDDKADILSHSQQFNNTVEAMIRQAPEQYFWMHNRWK